MEKLYSSLMADIMQVLRFWFWAELDMTEQVQPVEEINMLVLEHINRMFSQANIRKNNDCSVEPVGEDMIGRFDSPVEQVDGWWREASL